MRKLTWDEAAKEKQDIFQFVRWLKQNGCWMCRTKPKTFVALEFHLKSTHGIDREFLPLFIEQFIKTKNDNKQI